MKKFIFALLFISSSAYAEKWLEMPNVAGGKIILLEAKCTRSEQGKVVIATTPQGDSINGCWYYFADMVHIAWDHGKLSSFNPSDFKFKESK